MPADPLETAAGAKTDTVVVELTATKQRLAFGAGAIAFLMATIGPAIAFDISLGPDNDAGANYKIFFTLLAGGLFLLGWKKLDDLSSKVFVSLVAISIISFIGYSSARQIWSCPYQLADNQDRIALGTTLTVYGRDVQRLVPETREDCFLFLSSKAGDAAGLYLWSGLLAHFLALYAAFVLAWLSLAIFLVAAARRSLRGGQA